MKVLLLLNSIAGFQALAQGPLVSGSQSGFVDSVLDLGDILGRFDEVTRNRLRLFGPQRELTQSVVSGIVTSLGGEAGLRELAKTGEFPKSFFETFNQPFELKIRNEGIFSDANLGGKRTGVQRSGFIARLIEGGSDLISLTSSVPSTNQLAMQRSAQGEQPFPSASETRQVFDEATFAVQGFRGIIDTIRIFADVSVEEGLGRVKAFENLVVAFLESIDVAVGAFKDRILEEAQAFASIGQDVDNALFQIRPPTVQVRIKSASDVLATFDQFFTEQGRGFLAAEGPERLRSVFEGVTGATGQLIGVLVRVIQRLSPASKIRHSGIFCPA